MHNQVKKLKLLLLPILFLSSSMLYAAGHESLDTVQQAAKDFILKNLSVEPDETINVRVTELDHILKMPMCNVPLDVNFPANSAGTEKVTAVEMTCNGTQPWHTYIPVDVQIMTKVLVAKHIIQRNDTITANDVAYQTMDRNALFSGYFKNADDIVGRTANRLISTGAVLTQNNLDQEILVHRDQAVEIIAKHNSIVVSMKGISKSDGVLNQPVKVFNPSSQKTLDAIVVGPNQAQVVG